MLNVVVRIISSLNSANLICRDTDISKYFIESLGIRDDESRLYLLPLSICFALRNTAYQNRLIAINIIQPITI